jgi:hypothetical protein
MIEPLAGERQRGETSKAIQACNDYLRMGPGRSLRLLHKQYKDEQKLAPTRILGTLCNWSSRYGWQRRAEAYDAELDRLKTERAEEIMRSGLALAHERVEKLKDLAAFLETQMYEQDDTGAYPNVWLPDVKQIGGGEHAERVDIERFNAALIGEFRATLDDIAKETGGRKQQMEHMGGFTVTYTGNVDPTELVDGP